jgi:copper chaperone CopZ
MSRAFLVFLVALTAAPLWADPAAPDRVYDVDFYSLNCAICRKAIKEQLMKMPNVKSVDYDLKTYKCYVTMNGNATLTMAQLEEAFKTSKYMPKGIVELKTPPVLPKAESSPAETKPAKGS